MHVQNAPLAPSRVDMCALQIFIIIIIIILMTRFLQMHEDSTEFCASLVRT